MGKVSNIIKNKFNNEPICNKKCLKSEKTINTKENFQGFYIPAIFVNSVYGKDEYYYTKVFLEKCLHSFFWRSIRNFGFLGFGSSSWDIVSF